MKKLVLLSVLLSGSVMATTEEVFNINEVGFSRNTETVFVRVDRLIPSTICGGDYFKLDQNDIMANRLYAAGLTAKGTNKRLKVRYESDECIGAGVEPRVIWLID